MDAKELLSESLITLTLNKVRTGLAILGVVIGIGSVITLISLGQAAQKSVEQQIKSLGSNLLTVSPGAQRSGGVRSAGGSSTTLTYDDAKAIKESKEISGVKNVSAEYSRNAQVVAGRNNTNTQIIGATPEYAIVRNINLAGGAFISQQQVDGLAKVVVLGPQVVTDLFGEGTNAVGQTVRISGQAFTIIGVTESKGGSGFMNQDDRIYVPLLTAQKLLFGANNLSSLAVEAESEKIMNQLREDIGYLLLARHRLKNPDQADFSIMSQEDILSMTSEVTGTFTALLSGIAAISLIVGGIGIMNIMLVTVTERTREIGLRKALGAKNKIITAQFLLEAVLVTFVGGLIGIILGVVAAFILSKTMSLPFTLSLTSIFMAFGVSAGIGILFGWYPAKKASQLEPIEALRYE